MSSLRRGLRGTGASIWTCGFSLCVRSWWLGSRPVPRTFIIGSSRCRAGPIRSVLLVAAVRGRALARGHGRAAEAHGAPHAPGAVWAAFVLGIAVSLAANVAAAPALEWKPMLVAGRPPVALLLSVELLAHRPGGRERVESAGGPAIAAAETRYEGGPNPDRDESEDTPRDENAAERDETAADRREVSESGREPSDGGESEEAPSGSPGGGRSRSVEVTAEEVMWEDFRRQLAAGRAPSGAELDRVAGTNNYGRAVSARWRRTGRIPATADRAYLNGGRGHS